MAVGTYRGSVDAGDGKSRRFRLLLWAAAPDRIHAEFLPPVGGPAVIIDGGGGRLAVTLVRERTAYVGVASPAAIGAVAGVAVPLEDLVRWIVSGPEPAPAEIVVRRQPEWGPGLPRALEIRSGARRLVIERRRLESGVALASGTGTGAVPAGVVERPIEELDGAIAAGEETRRPERP